MQEEKREESTEKPVTEELPKNDFTLAQIEDIWDQYLLEIQRQDMHASYAVSKLNFEKQGDTITLILPNEIAKEEFFPYSGTFFKKAQEGVGHYAIIWEYRILPPERKEILTTRQKFEKLAEKYPNLLLLDKEFDLEFE